jgi:hypothetical protein
MPSPTSHPAVRKPDEFDSLVGTVCSTQRVFDPWRQQIYASKPVRKLGSGKIKICIDTPSTTDRRVNQVG